ncbi:hypothetical protein HKD37_10G028433 [Glycine soja]
MATPPALPPPPPAVASTPVVHIDPATGKADGPQKKKLRTYLGIVAHDKVDVTYETWKEAEFEILEAFDSRTKKKVLQIELAADKYGVDDTVCEKYGINKDKWVQFCQTHRDPSWEDVRKKAQAILKQNTALHVLSRGGYDYLEQKLMVEKTKKKLEETAQSGSTEGVINPPSPIRRHVKWKMAPTKKTRLMSSEVAKEITEKIDSLEEQASQGSFVPHGRQDVLTAAIGRPEHPGRVRAAGAGVTIKTRATHSTNLGPVGGVDHKKSDSVADGIVQPDAVPASGLALPSKPEVGPLAARVSTKGSCVDPSRNDPETGDSNKCRLYIEENSSHLVALGRVYEGSTAVHNIPLLHGQVKVGVEEVKDAEAPVLVPTNEVQLVGQALNTFLAWLTHLVKHVLEQAVVSPTKPPDRPNHEVMWDATVFGVFNQDFPLYIKHEDLSKISHGGQCLSISVIQLWILHLTKTSMRAGNSDVNGFLEPQSIQRSGQSQFESESYIKSWMQSSKHDIMGSPPASTTLPPPSPSSPPRSLPTSDASASTSAVKRTRKASRLRSLSTRPPGVERPVVHVDPATGKADGPHRKKLRTYLGIVARDKVEITYENWKEVPTAQKDLIWEDIQTVGERWRQFKSDLTRKWALAADQDSVEDTDVRIKAQAIQKQNTAPHILSRGDQEEATQSRSVDGVIDPPSLVRRHVKWKMARTKKTGEMTTEAAKEIAEKIDVLAAAIGCPEHPGRVRATGAGVTIKQYFGSAPRMSRSASSLPPDELQQLTQQIRDQLEESITEKVTRQVMASFSQLQSQMQSHRPPEPLVGPGPSDPRVSTKGSCVDPSGNDPETGDSDRCDFYIEADPARLVSVGRVYEGSTLVHNTPLLPDQVKVSADEVKDADAPVPIPTDEVSLVGQALHTFLAWPTHLVKSLSHQVAVSPPKPPLKPDPKVDDPLYLMTLTIPELFLRPYQVRWDATVFEVVNPDFPLYIKHEDLSKIVHGGQCLSISVLQLWILHLTETCMRAGNSDIYGFLEPQSIQRSGQSQFESESYIKSWMQSSQHDRTLADGGHPAQGTLSVHCITGQTTTLRGLLIMLSRVLMMLHSLNKRLLLGGWSSRQKGTTECGYYYFNDPRPLEPERLKALWIQWAQFYLQVRDRA